MLKSGGFNLLTEIRFWIICIFTYPLNPLPSNSMTKYFTSVEMV